MLPKQDLMDSEKLKNTFLSDLNVIFHSPNNIIKGIDLFQLCFDWCQIQEPGQLFAILQDYVTNYCRNDIIKVLILKSLFLTK